MTDLDMRLKFENEMRRQGRDVSKERDTGKDTVYKDYGVQLMWWTVQWTKRQMEKYT